MNILASSLEYPERIRVDSVVETSVPCLCVCKFSHFSLFHPSLFIQYSTEECSTVQLLASSLEYPERIRVDSVVETSDCLFLVSKFSNFFLFHPSIFIQYSTEECSTVQLLASFLEYPERIRVDSVVETCVCSLLACLLVSKFSHFSLFHSSLFIQYSTEECITVQLLASSLDLWAGTV